LTEDIFPTKKIARENGWRQHAHHGWLCPKCVKPYAEEESKFIEGDDDDDLLSDDNDDKEDSPITSGFGGGSFGGGGGAF
jgi:hypothetical protein